MNRILEAILKTVGVCLILGIGIVIGRGSVQSRLEAIDKQSQRQNTFVSGVAEIDFCSECAVPIVKLCEEYRESE